MDKPQILLELEDFVGFALERPRISPSDGKPHDERFSYQAAVRFYGKENDLSVAISLATKATALLRRTADDRSVTLAFALLGNLYYIQGDFVRSINCFLKALSREREDITLWMELAFALRAQGEEGLFDAIVYDADSVYERWKDSSVKELDEKGLREFLS